MIFLAENVTLSLMEILLLLLLLRKATSIKYRCVDFFAMTYVDWFYYKKINESVAVRLAKSILGFDSQTQKLQPLTHHI